MFLGGFTSSTHDHGISTQKGKLAGFIEFVEVNFQQAVNAWLFTSIKITTGKAEQRMDSSDIVGFVVGFICPGFRVLPLNGNTCGITQMIIFTAEVRPYRFDCFWIGCSMKRFKTMPFFSSLVVRAGCIQGG